MAALYPTIIPGLRGPGEMVNGIVHFGRMLDKIRLAMVGKLPEAWSPLAGQATRPVSIHAVAVS
jgi:gluconokinase